MDLIGNFNIAGLIRETIKSAVADSIDLWAMKDSLDEQYVRAMQFVGNMFVKSKIAIDGSYGHITNGLFNSLADRLGINPRAMTLADSERLLTAAGLDPDQELPRDPLNQLLHPDIPEATGSIPDPTHG